MQKIAEERHNAAAPSTKAHQDWPGRAYVCQRALGRVPDLFPLRLGPHAPRLHTVHEELFLLHVRLGQGRAKRHVDGWIKARRDARGGGVATKRVFSPAHMPDLHHAQVIR
jgi:hypothetical protein